MIEQLNKIKNEADGILKAAKEIRESSESGVQEEIQVNDLVEIAIARALNTHQNSKSEVKLQRVLAKDIPLIHAERNRFLDTLTSIVKNGIEAIDETGNSSYQDPLPQV